MKEVFADTTERFNDLEIRIKSEFDRIVNSATDDDFKEYDQLLNFVQLLKRNFPDFQKFSLYHILAGSSAKHGEVLERGDFPGNFSVDNFFNLNFGEREELLNKLSNNF